MKKRNATNSNRPPRTATNGNREDPLSLEANIVKLSMNGELAKISQRAIAEHLSRGFPITFMRGEEVIKQYPDGREEVLARVPGVKFRLPKNIEILDSQ